MPEEFEDIEARLRRVESPGGPDHDVLSRQQTEQLHRIPGIHHRERHLIDGGRGEHRERLFVPAPLEADATGSFAAPPDRATP